MDCSASELTDEQIVNMVMNPTTGMQGRIGGVIKPHLKKEDAVKKLKDQLVRSVKKSDETPDVSPFPAELVSFLDSVKKTITDVKYMKSQDMPVLETLLRHASDEELKMLKEIMSSGGGMGRSGTTESKVLKSINTVFHKMEMLENAKIAIQKMQENLTID